MGRRDQGIGVRRVLGPQGVEHVRVWLGFGDAQTSQADGDLHTFLRRVRGEAEFFLYSFGLHGIRRNDRGQGDRSQKQDEAQGQSAGKESGAADGVPFLV